MTIAEKLGINRVVLALSTARLADALGNSILIIILPLYVAQLPSPIFNLPDSVLVGILISLYGLVNTLLQPIFGVLSDRISRRKPLIIVGLFLMGAGTLAFVFASQFSHLLLIRVLQGFGVALTVPASLALMAASTIKQTRGGSMGVYSTMRMVGFATGPVIGGFLHINFGSNTAFYVGASFVIIAMIMVSIWVHEKPNVINSLSNEPFKLFDRTIWSTSILALGIAGFIMASSFSLMTALENEFNARLDQTALGFGIAFSALTLSRLIVQIPLGRLSDQIGRKPLIISGLILLAPATVFLGYVGTTLGLTGARAFQGLASAAIAAPTFALAGDLSKVGGEGRQMSVITTGFFLGIAVGPLVAGVLATYFFELPFLVGGIMSLLGALVVSRFVSETVNHQSS
ncbi:MAG: MFS transporter [Anaerolineales bacterium]|jgi:MFS family permease